MKNYKIDNILFPTDFSETAGKAQIKAIELSKKLNARLVFIHVVEIPAYAPHVEMISIGMVTETMIDSAKQKLKELSTKAKEEHGIRVDYSCYSGHVYDNIIRAAHLANADLIVMGTHGTSGISEWLFGSNAFSVVNNTTIPVLTINFHSDQNTFQKIVFPFNENLLTLKKINQVIALAKTFNSTVLLLGFAGENSNEELVSLHKKGEELSRAFTTENIRNTFSMSLGNNYADEILQFAAKEKADMITVATNRDHTIGHVFESKPEKKLVNHSEIPVLSIPVE